MPVDASSFTFILQLFNSENVEIFTLNKYTVSKLNQMGPICLKVPTEMNKHQAGYHR